MEEKREKREKRERRSRSVSIKKEEGRDRRD